MASNNDISAAEFLGATGATKFEEARSWDGARVSEKKEFERMREHILGTFEGADVEHSYVDPDGQVWDCIPIEQQVSLRDSPEGPASPPELPSQEEWNPEEHKDSQAVPSPEAPSRDPLGNQMSCPSGTIPVRRVSLSEMVRFESVEGFLLRGNLGKRHPRLSGARPDNQGPPHEYAHGYQSVNNWGGASGINLQQPVVGPGEIFSLSQQWFAGGTGSGLQTVECGWQVYPSKWKTESPVLFIYWTPDDYQTGGYNLEGGSFVQTNSGVALGGKLTPTPKGGPQRVYTLSYLKNDTGWWFYLSTSTPHKTVAVGYYKLSLFQSGQMSRYATDIDFGGETVGNSYYPPMGTGQFATSDWGVAAFQRGILYYPPGGSPLIQPAELTIDQTNPSNYTAEINKSYQGGPYLFFGGPGGPPPSTGAASSSERREKQT